MPDTDNLNAARGIAAWLPARRCSLGDHRNVAAMSTVVSLPLARVEAIVFDPFSGELYHSGGVVQLTRMRSDLLAMLVEAKGDVVPLEAVDALSRGYAGYSVPGSRRRALVRNLRAQLRSVGLDIETRTGFGYRLRGNVQLRDMFFLDAEPRQQMLGLVL